MPIPSLVWLLGLPAALMAFIGLVRLLGWRRVSYCEQVATPRLDNLLGRNEETQDCLYIIALQMANSGLLSIREDDYIAPLPSVVTDGDILWFTAAVGQTWGRQRSIPLYDCQKSSDDGKSRLTIPKTELRRGEALKLMLVLDGPPDPGGVRVDIRLKRMRRADW